MGLTFDMRKAISRPTVAMSLLFTQRAGTIIYPLLEFHVPLPHSQLSPQNLQRNNENQNPHANNRSLGSPNFFEYFIFSLRPRGFDYETMNPPTILPVLIHAKTNGAHHSGILQADYLRQLSNKYHRDRMIGPPELAQNPEPDPET